MEWCCGLTTFILEIASAMSSKFNDCWTLLLLRFQSSMIAQFCNSCKDGVYIFVVLDSPLLRSLLNFHLSVWSICYAASSLWMLVTVHVLRLFWCSQVCIVIQYQFIVSVFAELNWSILGSLRRWIFYFILIRRRFLVLLNSFLICVSIQDLIWNLEMWLLSWQYAKHRVHYFNNCHSLAWFGSHLHVTLFFLRICWIRKMSLLWAQVSFTKSFAWFQ